MESVLQKPKNKLKANFFKLFLSLLSILFLSFFVSCRSDKDDASAQVTLQGNWRPDKMYIESTQNGTTIPITIITNDCQKKGRVNFATNNAGHLKLWSDDSGDCVVTSDEDFNYNHDSASGNLTITLSGQNLSGKVTTLTANQLVFYYVDNSNPGISNKIEITATRVTN